MTGSEAGGVCRWCGTPVARSGSRGPAPRYCSPAHRQRAYEARRPEQLANRLDQLSRRVEDELAALAERITRLETERANPVDTPGAHTDPEEPVADTERVTMTSKQPVRQRHKPYLVVQRRLGDHEPARGGGADPRVLSAHTTENAAQRAMLRGRSRFIDKNGWTAAQRWTWGIEREDRRR